MTFFDQTLGDGGPARIVATIVPTGGIIVLKFEDCNQTGTWVLSRSVGSGSNLVSTQLYSGVSLPLFVDAGDGLKTPLVSTQAYTYTLTTPTDNLTLGPIIPGGEIQIEPDTLTGVMLRVLQAGFANLALPTKITKRPDVIHAMPLGGRPSLPLVSFALEAMNDVYVPSGQNVSGYDNQPVGVVYDITNRRYRVSVMAENVDEREFFRDAVLGIFRTILGPLLDSLGQNVTHSYHAASSQVAAEKQIPAFYFSDISLQFSGTYSVQVVYQSPGLMESIGNSVTYGLASYPNP